MKYTPRKGHFANYDQLNTLQSFNNYNNSLSLEMMNSKITSLSLVDGQNDKNCSIPKTNTGVSKNKRQSGKLTPKQYKAMVMIYLEKQKQEKLKSSMITNFHNSRFLRIENNLTRRHLALREHIANSLKCRGFCVLDKYLGAEKSSGVLSEVLDLWKQNLFQSGRLVSFVKDVNAVRSDEVCWVDGSESDCANISGLLQLTDTVLASGSGILPEYRITGGTKAMLCCYPGEGSHYNLHVDNPNKDGRCITCTYFLNPGWDSKKFGGNLKILARTCGKTSEIEPLLDRVVFFYSDKRNPHRVMPTIKNRFSITFWYFDHDQRISALKTAQLKLQHRSTQP